MVRCTMRLATRGVVPHEDRAEMGKTTRFVATLVGVETDARSLTLNSASPRIRPRLEGDLGGSVLLGCSLSLGLSRTGLLMRWRRRQDRLLALIGP